ncbi:MAG: type VI secretion system contractile sheath small subunit [Verrucomicrobia bacterium]|nr:type VI secretion system contractile sheath small subunit [Verrucomicrobiota bacterium]
MAVQDEIPKSRITLTYKTEVNGEPAVVDLPFRMMIPADLSLGTSKDRQKDLDERSPRNLNGSNTSDVLKDMGITLNIVVPNKVSAESQDLNVNLAITGIDSFSPHEIAKQVPEIQSLLLFKKLLEEIQSNIANKKEFAQLLNKLYANPAALEKIKEELKTFAPTLPQAEIGFNKSEEQKDSQ